MALANTVELMKAIKTRYTAASLGSTFTGGFHFEVAPDGTAMPFLVLNIISTPAIESYGGTMHLDAEVQFTAVAAISGSTPAVDVALNAAAAVTAAFDGQTLSFSGQTPSSTATNIDLFRLDWPTPLLMPEGEPGENENISDVAGARVSYRMSAQ